ncbi:N-acetylglucosamine-6-phosphate deacetylase [Maledivibacter halophilus]|uniref:N-acetylglucosamine-6-phosphate deacetylase n=1 Tax=Maledivibacter halophilus TaxID=36842 RepID=A0A1T5I9B3_9FIRM|nr:N-acetylglucosamine-6-phosphate deacetylase [Maledivibacter halophilus]SKC35757.1 N-acetylglucosamine-6-phosphate deacetylase [Maledivibacter halophilus]
MRTLVKNSRIITPYEIKVGYSLVVEDDKIEDMIKNENIDESVFDKVIDLKGKYLSSGFIDIHNHGNYGHDAMEGTYDALESMGNYHIKNGVTGYLATTMTNSTENTIRAIKNVASYIHEKNKEGSKVLGLYLEGPYFSQEKKGAQPPEYIKAPDIEELEMLLKEGKDTVKVVAIAPELKNAKEAIRYLKKQGITISAGHTNANYQEAMKGIERGITQATHLYNGMRGFSHREPGVLGAVLTDERVACEMICDGIHIHKAAMNMAVKLKGKDKIILISDAMMAAGLKDGKYQLGGQDVFVKDREARLESGALAGSTLTLNKAVYNMVHLVGVSLNEAVQMASLNPAKAIGIDNYKGSIEIGKDADIIAFNENLDVSFVMVEGHVIDSQL